MRVAVVRLDPCRLDARVLRQAGALAGAGHEVRVVAVAHPESPDHEQRDGFEIVRISLSGARSAPTSRLGRVVRRFQRVGRFARGAPGAILAHRPDICHAHDLPVLPMTWLVARRSGARVVYDSHELFPYRNVRSPSPLGRWLLARLEAWLIHRVDAVVTTCDGFAEVLAGRYRVARPTVVRNIPARPGGSRPVDLRRPLGIPATAPVLIYVGALTFNRGLELSIDALAQLPRAHLVLLGYGEAGYIETLHQRARRAGVAERLHRYGPVPPERVVDHLEWADIGLAPIEDVCLSYHHCLPNKIFEYARAALPVVATRLPEMQRVVEGSGIGQTFAPGEVQGLVEAIRSLLDRRHDPDLRAACHEVARRFTWEREQHRLLDLYRRLEEAA